MGNEEAIFIDLVLKRLRKKDSHVKILKKVSIILDKDSDDFVYKLWRMLIFQIMKAEKNLW